MDLKKTIYSPRYQRFIELLHEARKKARLTQYDVADRLGKPQSFVAKYENGERRLDVVEFLAIAEALDTDPVKIIRKLLQETPPG